MILTTNTIEESKFINDSFIWKFNSIMEKKDVTCITKITTSYLITESIKHNNSSNPNTKITNSLKIEGILAYYLSHSVITETDTDNLKYFLVLSKQGLFAFKINENYGYNDINEELFILQTFNLFNIYFLNSFYPNDYYKCSLDEMSIRDRYNNHTPKDYYYYSLFFNKTLNITAFKENKYLLDFDERELFTVLSISEIKSDEDNNSYVEFSLNNLIENSLFGRVIFNNKAETNSLIKLERIIFNVEFEKNLNKNNSEFAKYYNNSASSLSKLARENNIPIINNEMKLLKSVHAFNYDLEMDSESIVKRILLIDNVYYAVTGKKRPFPSKEKTINCSNPYYRHLFKLSVYIEDFKNLDIHKNSDNQLELVIQFIRLLDEFSGYNPNLDINEALTIFDIKYYRELELEVEGNKYTVVVIVYFDAVLHTTENNKKLLCYNKKSENQDMIIDIQISNDDLIFDLFSDDRNNIILTTSNFTYIFSYFYNKDNKAILYKENKISNRVIVSSYYKEDNQSTFPALFYIGEFEAKINNVKYINKKENGLVTRDNKSYMVLNNFLFEIEYYYSDTDTEANGLINIIYREIPVFENYNKMLDLFYNSDYMITNSSKSNSYYSVHKDEENRIKLKRLERGYHLKSNKLSIKSDLNTDDDIISNDDEFSIKSVMRGVLKSYDTSSSLIIEITSDSSDFKIFNRDILDNDYDLKIKTLLFVSIIIYNLEYNSDINVTTTLNKLGNQININTNKDFTCNVVFGYNNLHLNQIKLELKDISNINIDENKSYIFSNINHNNEKIDSISSVLLERLLVQLELLNREIDVYMNSDYLSLKEIYLFSLSNYTQEDRLICSIDINNDISFNHLSGCDNKLTLLNKANIRSYLTNIIENSDLININSVLFIDNKHCLLSLSCPYLIRIDLSDFSYKTFSLYSYLYSNETSFCLRAIDELESNISSNHNHIQILLYSEKELFILGLSKINYDIVEILKIYDAQSELNSKIVNVKLDYLNKELNNIEIILSRYSSTQGSLSSFDCFTIHLDFNYLAHSLNRESSLPSQYNIFSNDISIKSEKLIIDLQSYYNEEVLSINTINNIKPNDCLNNTHIVILVKRLLRDMSEIIYLITLKEQVQGNTPEYILINVKDELSEENKLAIKSDSLQSMPSESLLKNNHHRLSYYKFNTREETDNEFQYNYDLLLLAFNPKNHNQEKGFFSYSLLKYKFNYHKNTIVSISLITEELLYNTNNQVLKNSPQEMFKEYKKMYELNLQNNPFCFLSNTPYIEEKTYQLKEDESQNMKISDIRVFAHQLVILKNPYYLEFYEHMRYKTSNYTENEKEYFPYLYNINSLLSLFNISTLIICSYILNPQTVVINDIQKGILILEVEKKAISDHFYNKFDNWENKSEINILSLNNTKLDHIEMLKSTYNNSKIKIIARNYDEHLFSNCKQHYSLFFIIFL